MSLKQVQPKEEKKKDRRKQFDTALPRPIETYISTSEFFASLNSEFTRLNYIQGLSRFMAYINSQRPADAKTDPDEVIKSVDLKQTVLKYIYYLRAVAKPVATKRVPGEFSVNSIPSFMRPIKSWMDYCEVPCPWWKKVHKLIPPAVTNSLRAYTAEEISKMIDLGDPFDRPCICLQKAAGSRVGGLEGAVIDQVIRLPENMGLLSVYPESARYHYTVPLDPETMFYLDESLEYRRMHGETITGKSPLIRDKFVPMGRNVNRAKAVLRSTVRDRMRVLCKEAGIPLDVIQPDHSFRYFFDTAMMNSDCKWEIKELMMGHSVGLEKYYYDEKDPKSRQKLIIEYMKGMNSLICSPRFKMDKRIKELEKDVKDVPKIETLQNALINKELETDTKLKAQEKRHEEAMAQLEQKMLARMDELQKKTEKGRADSIKKEIEES